MKVIATVYKTIALKKELNVVTLQGAYDMLEYLDEMDFDDIQVIEGEIEIEKIEEN